MKWKNEVVRLPAKAAGFTLIEILIVITIIGIVAAVIVGNVSSGGDEARARLLRPQLEELGGKLALFKLDVGRFPTSSEGLKALQTNPGNLNNWSGPYVSKESQLKDPWNNEFIYASPGQKGPYDLKSLGADGREGGEGPNRDVSNN